MTAPKTPRCNEFFGPMGNAEVLNPAEKLMRVIEGELTEAKWALERRCNCRFTQGGFHTAACDYHTRLQEELKQVKKERDALQDKIDFLMQKPLKKA